MSALILDTETTSVDEPEVIQLGYMGPVRQLTAAGLDESVQVARFKPSKPISLGAMAVHHIIEADLADAPAWRGEWALPYGTEYLVGHNIDFDWKAIGQPHVARICTLALSRSLWPDLDSHSLSALTYHFTEHSEARDLLRNAHDAGRDVELCCRLILHILRALPHVSSWHELWQASEKARVPSKFWFGKYDGRLIREIRREDPGYIHWCLTKCDQVTGDPYAQKAMRGEAA